MNNRLTIEEYGCALSLIGKGRSEDYFTRTAAVAIAEDKRILGIAYNGLSDGMIVPDWMKLEENRAKKSDFYIHDVNNLFPLLKKGECHTLCATLAPCIACARIACAYGVSKVVFLKEYHRCDKYKEFFDFHGIECYELSSASKKNIQNYLSDMNNFKELV